MAALLKNLFFSLSLLSIGSDADVWNLKVVRAEGNTGDSGLYLTIQDPTTEEMIGRTTTIDNDQQWDESFTIDNTDVPLVNLKLYDGDNGLIDETSINMAPNTDVIADVCDVELAERLPLEKSAGYLFVLLFQDCGHAAPDNEIQSEADYVKSIDDYVDQYANKSVADIGVKVDIGKLANYAGVWSTGQGIVGLFTGDYGGTVRTKNYLCGGHLIYESGFYLAKGSFKAHCSSVLEGTEAGCTVTGWWNNGIYGMVQYQFVNTTAIPDQCTALNVFFEASQGWGLGSQKKNRVDAFWSNERCERREDNKDDISCYLNQRRNRDNKKCWTAPGVYDPICSEKWDDPPARGICQDIQALGFIGSGNNPEITIEIRAIDAPIGECGAPTQP